MIMGFRGERAGMLIKRFLLPFGRLSRREFLAAFLVSMSAGMPWALAQRSYFVAAAAKMQAGQPLPAMELTPLLLLLWLSGVYVSLIAHINRLHDLERSGFNLLLPLLPIIIYIGVVWKFGLVSDAAGDPMRIVVGLAGVAVYGIAFALGVFILVNCLFAKGDADANRYGPPPAHRMNHSLPTPGS